MHRRHCRNAFASAVWGKENELLLRVYVIGNNISIKMGKVAEWFPDEYEGTAYDSQN